MLSLLNYIGMYVQNYEEVGEDRPPEEIFTWLIWLIALTSVFIIFTIWTDFDKVFYL